MSCASPGTPPTTTTVACREVACLAPLSPFCIMRSQALSTQPVILELDQPGTPPGAPGAWPHACMLARTFPPTSRDCIPSHPLEPSKFVTSMEVLHTGVVLQDGVELLEAFRWLRQAQEHCGAGPEGDESCCFAAVLMELHRGCNRQRWENWAYSWRSFVQRAPVARP